MKTLFQAFAKYNASVNQSVLELLKPLKREQMMMETKAYYPSIYETLFHIFSGDLTWLKRYKTALNENQALSDELVSLDPKGLRKEFESDYTKLFQYRRRLDEVITRFAHEVEESNLNVMIRYKNLKGEEIEKELWKTLLHWFNHQTHHRGQISVLLDLIGIDHDYSSLVTRV